MGMLDTIQSGREAKPPRIMIYGSEGVGKAQPLDALVLTPSGFVPMNDIQVGSKVIGSDGKPHNVLGIYPQGEKEVFRVTFRDGCSTECCDDHLWFTQTRGERDRNYPGSVRTLHTIRNSIRYGTHFNHAVPRVAPVEFSRNEELPLAPWLLGIYLAEGSGAHSISNPEQDIQARITANIPAGDKATLHQGDVAIHKGNRGSKAPSHFRAALRELGIEDKISDTKFIPEQYLYSSVADRLELLRGLCDGDGYVGKPGSFEICTASPQMARGIMFLIRSLGGSAVCSVRPGKYRKDGDVHMVKDSHRIYGVFTNGIVPVSSSKHLNKWDAPEWMIRNTIRSVESVGKKECQCIIIDAIDSLYVTNDFILTHNSTFAASAPGAIFIQTEDGLGEIDCSKFPLAHSLADVFSALAALRDEPHDFQCVAVDSVDWLERLIFDEVCREFGVRSIEKADGGYGRGY
ncbi:MAG: AAA family ATPase, partial [Lentisphaerae bacterium]|nr:AAA family ATPase [Lentisphaerota bacterium]